MKQSLKETHSFAPSFNPRRANVRRAKPKTRGWGPSIFFFPFLDQIRHCIIFHRIGEGDSGVYSCQAVNPLGEAVCEAEFQIVPGEGIFNIFIFSFLLRTEVRDDFTIHGTKYFLDAVFYRKLKNYDVVSFLYPL